MGSGQKLTASDERNGVDRPPVFGYRIAASGGRLAVGAYGADGIDPSAIDAGAVYVFERGAVGWTETARLEPPVPYDAHLTFGEAVDLDGDRLVVGMTGIGAANGACLFEWDGTTWKVAHQALPPGLAIGDDYGEDVRIRGDRMLVLAPGHAVGDGRVGVAFIWERVNGTWQVAAELAHPFEPGKPPGGITFTAAMDGDWVALSDDQDDAVGFGTGVVYLFQRGADGWLARSKIAAVDGHAGDLFGRGMTLWGSRLAVGTQKDVGWGAVYVYDAAFDSDSDAVPDPLDGCPAAFDPVQADGDRDGVGDACDGCPGAWDDRQEDADGDHVGDVCDPCTDADHDGYGVMLTSACPRGPTLDCVDRSPEINPGMPEVLLDGIDNDCNPDTPVFGPDCAAVAARERTAPPAAAPWLAASGLAVWRAGRRRLTARATSRRA